MFAIAKCYINSHFELKFGKESIVEFNECNVNNGNFDCALGNLIRLFRKYNKTIFGIQNEGMKETLFNCLYLYKDECRNPYFHKKNNYSWENVERIRHNTLFLYIILLGGQKATAGKQFNINFNVIENDQMERIYYEIRQRGIKEIYIRFDNEDVNKICKIEPSSDFPLFDEYGLFKENFKLLCSSECLDGEQVVISKDNLPADIGYREGEQIMLIDYNDEQRIKYD